MSVLDSPRLRALSAGDLMSPTAHACPPRATLAQVAAAMVVHQVHLVVLEDTLRGITALDAVRAAATTPDATAGELARDIPAVDVDEGLVDIALVMAEHGEPHLLVPAPGSATRVISSLDIAAAVADRPRRTVRQVRPGPARPAISTPRLRDVRVDSLMHHGVVSCPPETPLLEVAASLVDHHVHCVAVDGSLSAVVTDLDVVTAVAAGADRMRAEQTGEPLPWIGCDDTLELAAQLMDATGRTHLLVGEREAGARGALSTLDILDVVAVGAD